MVGGPAGGVLETIGKVSAAEVLRAWRRGRSLLFGLVCTGLTCPGPSISDWLVKDWILETELMVTTARTLRFLYCDHLEAEPLQNGRC